MELFTSSYRAWRPGMGSPVVASLSVPHWLPDAQDWPRLREATPRWSYFDAEPAEFERQYLAQLELHGPQAISRSLVKIAREAYLEPSERLVLLCWESRPDQCHRGLFASWLLERTGELAAEIP